ncbi:MAG: bis(5'-nucleosyl)-tetraphosphatase (symmetrical) YqeK [bacterium]|nr:bis(5'-nucleosyl)-tetraphosphatase (symmetrical) YqeK [bacterium]
MEHKLATYLDQPKYLHSLGVKTTALRLAKQFAVDGHQAQIAGLLHDCARCFPITKQKAILQTYPDVIDAEEQLIPELWHAPISALIAQTEFNIHAPDILAAIRYHSTGRAQMSELEKVIFIADYIEPYRAFEIPDTIKRSMSHSLTELTLAVLEAKLDFLKKQRQRIHSRGIEAVEYLKHMVQTDRTADTNG